MITAILAAAIRTYLNKSLKTIFILSFHSSKYVFNDIRHPGGQKQRYNSNFHHEVECDWSGAELALTSTVIPTSIAKLVNKSKATGKQVRLT